MHPARALVSVLERLASECPCCPCCSGDSDYTLLVDAVRAIAALSDDVLWGVERRTLARAGDSPRSAKKTVVYRGLNFDAARLDAAALNAHPNLDRLSSYAVFAHVAWERL